MNTQTKIHNFFNRKKEEVQWDNELEMENLNLIPEHLHAIAYELVTKSAKPEMALNEIAILSNIIGAASERCKDENEAFRCTVMSDAMAQVTKVIQVKYVERK